VEAGRLQTQYHLIAETDRLCNTPQYGNTGGGMLTEQELRRMIHEWILRQGQAGEAAPLNEQSDLIASGALDSMGFIELLAYIESATGQKVDLQEVDVSALTSIDGLVRHIVRSRSFA
jgi:acyl carrier protein